MTQSTRTLFAIPFDNEDPKHCGLTYRADESSAVRCESADTLDTVKQKLRVANEDWSEEEIEGIKGYWVVTEAELGVLSFISGSHECFRGSDDVVDDGLHTMCQTFAKKCHESRVG